MSPPKPYSTTFKVYVDDIDLLLEATTAPVRAFWTDEELLEVSGLQSVPLLKKVQATGWIRAGQMPLPGGGRRRAWPLRDVMKTILATKFAASSGVAVLGIATLLQSLPARWQADAVDHWVSFAAGGAAAHQPTPSARVWLVDMAEAWCELDEHHLGLGAYDLNLFGTDIRARSVSHAPEIARAVDLADHTAILILNPANVLRPFVASVILARSVAGPNVRPIENPSSQRG